MSRRILFSCVLTGLLVLPIAASARNSDGDLRFCEQQAVNTREQRLIDTTRNYHINWFNLLEERRQRYFDSWGIENDRDRGNVQRDIDRDIRTRLRDNDNNYRSDQKNITNDFRNDDRACQDQYKQRLRDVPVGLICFSSDVCRPPLGICSTDLGECRPDCPPKGDLRLRPCVCSGRCRLR